MSNNYNNIFNDLFKAFIDRNPFLVTSASKFTNNINSSNSEKILLNNMSLHDFQYFTDLKKELKNKKICNYITNIYCLLFNECMNINNDLRRKDMICSSLKQYLSNIIDEINEELLTGLEDKNFNNNITKSQRQKPNEKYLRITINLLFLILAFMINKYKTIIDNTLVKDVIKGINVKNLNTTKIREELFFLIILEQNLYWINIILEGLSAIFQNLRNNKFKLLINSDTEFNNLDENFKNYCFECFLNLFNIVKKYSTIKFDERDKGNFDVLFNSNSGIKDNNLNNFYLPLNIIQIDKTIFNLFECFVYEFMNDIDSIWKYYDDIELENDKSDKSEILFGFGIYLCDFLKLIIFVRNENLSKVDFFNFFLFSYKLITSYFSKLNLYLYGLFNKISDGIKYTHIIITPDFNINYLQNLSNVLKDLLFNFMISSFNNDVLKDAYSFNDFLMDSIITHCFIQTIIPIYSLILNGNNPDLLFQILSILLDNINKYKIILPLKCHYIKELIAHNFLLILDEFLVNNEKEIIFYFRHVSECKDSNLKIINLITKFNQTLSCLFNHYNPINFLYSNHIMFQFNEIILNSGITYSGINPKISNIFLRYINSEKNPLNYLDIPISEIYINEKYNPNFNANLKRNNNNDDENNDITFDNVTYNQEMALEVNSIGFALDKYFNKNIIELFSTLSNEEYKFNICRNKNYLIKISGGKNYSIIYIKGDDFIEQLGIDENLKENILNIMENVQYTDKNVYKLIQEKVINPGNVNIVVNKYFYDNLKYYDLKFEMDYFQYQRRIKELLL